MVFAGEGSGPGSGIGVSGKLAGRRLSQHGLGGTLFREFGVWQFPGEEVLWCGSGFLGARDIMGAVYDDGYDLPGVLRKEQWL